MALHRTSSTFIAFTIVILFAVASSSSGFTISRNYSDSKNPTIIQIVINVEGCCNKTHSDCEGNSDLETITTSTVSELDVGPPLRLYQNDNFDDLIFDGNMAPGNECLDLPPLAQGKASSLKTEASCLILHEKFGCEGKSVRITDESTDVGSLSKYGFNDQANSVQGC